MSAALSYRYPLLQSLCLPNPARSTSPLSSAGCPIPRATERLSWGSAPYSVCGVRSPLDPEVPPSGTFRPQGFAPSRRLPPPRASQVYFALERSWDFPFRAFFLRKSRAPLGAFPLRLFSRAFIHGWKRQRYRARTRQRCWRQLQGVALSRSPRLQARGLAERGADALLGFISSGVSPSRWCAALSGALLSCGFEGPLAHRRPLARSTAVAWPLVPLQSVNRP